MTNPKKGSTGKRKIKQCRPFERRVEQREKMHECMAPDEPKTGLKNTDLYSTYLKNIKTSTQRITTKMR